jgi:DNA polymerase-3 subunit beta
MKIMCDRVALHDALTATTAVIATRTPKPILQCIRVTAAKDELILTAYDQELGLRYHVKEVEVSKPGETLVPGERMAAIVRESADETLAIETEGDACHVRGSDSHFQIFGQDVRQFPPVPELEGEPDVRVGSGLLRSCIERTVFAAAKESTRYAINGVLWEKRGKKLQLIATDGRRLAKAAASLEKSVGEDVDVIVPSKAMSTFVRLHMDADEPVDLKVSQNQLILRAARATISTVLLDGHFPKYEDVIPKDCDKKIELETAEFLSAVRRAALLTNEESRGVRIAVSSDGLVFSSRAPEQGEATIRVSASYSGPKMEIGFNPAFLIDALRVCGEKVSFELKEQNKPGLLRSGPEFLYVVMPVNLS